MKYIAAILLAITTTAYAELPQGTISNFSGNYLEPSGTAHASEFNFAEAQFGKDVDFSIEKQAGVFYLQTPDESVEINGVPDMLLSLNTLSIKDVNLSSTKQNISFGVEHLSGRNTDQNLAVNGLSINCDYEAFDGEVMSEVLHSCLNKKGTIRLANFLSQSNKTATTISNLYLQTTNNKMNFQIKASGYNISGYGETYFEPGKIRLKITKAKVGILNVRSKLFSELEKAEGQGIHVNEPWVEIDL